MPRSVILPDEFYTNAESASYFSPYGSSSDELLNNLATIRDNLQALEKTKQRKKRVRCQQYSVSNCNSEPAMVGKKCYYDCIPIECTKESHPFLMRNGQCLKRDVKESRARFHLKSASSRNQYPPARHLLGKAKTQTFSHGMSPTDLRQAKFRKKQEHYQASSKKMKSS